MTDRKEGKNKALFIDRDGTINNDEGKYYIYKVEDFVFNDGVFELIRKYQSEGYMIIIISNQGGIAKGIYSHLDVKKVHKYMLEEFKKEGITVDEIYYCPHHSGITKCLCRKPAPLMIEKAIARFGIDPAQSYFVGDSERDMQAAERAGVKGIHIKANHFNFVLD